MENCVAPGFDEFDVLLEVVLSLVKVDSLINRLNQPESAVFQLCSFTVFPKDPFFSDYLVCLTVFLKFLIHGFYKTWDKMLWVEYLNVLIWCRKIINRYV